MTSALKALLDAIGSHEAPRGYGQIYGGARGVPMDTDVSKLTLDGVLNFQERMLDGGSASTACGRYQFLRKTLLATIGQMGLTGHELWSPDLQDRMAIHLMKGRGLEIYLAGHMSREAFANNLAMEWASLPVVTRIKGAHRIVDPGETYYAGDKLNRAFHKPEAVLALLDALKMPADGTLPRPAPDTAPSQPAKPRGLLLALIELLMSIFKRK